MAVKKKVKSLFRSLGKIISRIPKPNLENLLILIILTVNFVIALSVRLLPLKYGIYLNEFDPYYQYFLASWIVERGWYGFIEWFFSGVDKTMWYPTGRDIPATSYPGVAFVGAFVYLILKSLGINLPLMFVTGLIPPFSAAITTVLLYFIGKELHNKVTGLLASFFFAVAAATVGRTVYGFYDDDSISQIYIALFIYGFIKSLKSDSLRWPILVGLSLSLVCITWGAYTYLVNLFALTTLALMLLGKFNERIRKTYLIGMTMPIITLILLPKTSSFFITSQFAFLPLITYVLIFIYSYLTKLSKIKIAFSLIIIVLSGLGLSYLLQQMGIIKGIYDKFIMVLNPFVKSGNPWVESVGEHAATTWVQFFINFGILFVFLPLGFFIIAKRAKEHDIFLILMGLTSIHATATVNRLFMLSAQPVVLISSIAFSTILLSYFEAVKSKKETFLERKRIRLLKGLPTSTSAATLLILFIILFLNLFLISPNAVTVASNPQSLLSGERGEVVNDWVATFSWMRDNLPEGTVVASWWDYGYWIRVLGGKVNVADNANYNFTQINLIAKALVSPENESIKIFRQLNASYVLVYEQFFNVGEMWIPIGGDLEKSYWMIRIAFNYDDATVRRLYLNQTQVNIGFQNIFLSLPTGEKGKQALIYKLIFYKIPGLRERYPQQIEDLKIGAPIYFTLVYHSPNGYVMIYKINYPDELRR